MATVGAGIGLVTLLWSCRLARPATAPDRPVRQGPIPAVEERSTWDADLGRALSAVAPLAAAIEPWLRLTGGSWVDLTRRMASGAVVAGVACGVAVAGVATAGLLGPVASVATVVVAAAAGAAWPVADLRRRADDRRRRARYALGSYLDLVVMCLAGGMGVEGALTSAAEVADDDFSHQVAHAVATAAAGGRPPWEALADVGRRLGLAELDELAATMRLAGTEGARVRLSLAAKADSLRVRQLAHSEAGANAVTERLFVPGVLLLVGFLVFIGYPALARILAGL